MTTLAITEALIPSIETLADILVQTSESYQQLLKQPESHAYCLEAGRSVRYLSSRYADVLTAAFDYTPESDDDYDDWEDEDDTSSEEALDE
ncbi:MAG: hypothetical protein EPN89_10530 [Methylovulum sp.]|nr:MAG: hypothetical protein EPN89_10530 [Methylovulum sp.]